MRFKICKKNKRRCYSVYRRSENWMSQSSLTVQLLWYQISWRLWLVLIQQSSLIICTAGCNATQDKISEMLEVRTPSSGQLSMEKCQERTKAGTGQITAESLFYI